MRLVNFKEEKILPIGLGTWHMGEQKSRHTEELTALKKGIAAGLAKGKLALDTAEMYGEGKAETLVGEALTSFSREDLYLISKVYPWNASTKQLPQSLDASLKRLGTDYLDLYLLHWTGTIPLAETVAAMEAAKQAGKIRQWGVSNFDCHDLIDLWKVPGGDRAVTNQVLYNLGTRGIEYDLLPWMRQQQLPLIAYSPIAQGDSLGHKFQENPLLKEMAADKGISLFQLLLAWVIAQPQTLAIPQSSNFQHVFDNLATVDIELTKAELVAIDQVYMPPTKKQPLEML